jgi:hypothetical protein
MVGSITMDLHRIIAILGRSESIASHAARKIPVQLQWQLLELIGYGPNTFGIHKKSGGGPGSIYENVTQKKWWRSR